MRIIVKFSVILSVFLGFIGVVACSPDGSSKRSTSEAAPAAQSVNIYTTRHYASDDAMFADFTKATGIAVNSRKGDSTSLVEIMKAEGENSPADIILAADAGSLWRFETAGLTQPLTDTDLLGNIPPNLKQPEGHWFGLTKRFRVIAYDKSRFNAEQFPTYTALADPAFAGEICVRPSSNIYNLSLMAEMIAHLGADGASEWATGVVANFARIPRGGDRTQLRGIAAGDCGIAVVNHYYWLRMLAGGEGDDFEAADKLALAFPDISEAVKGTHTNITAIALAKHAPNSSAAYALMEYLISADGQKGLILETYEKPLSKALPLATIYNRLPDYVETGINLDVLGENQAQAQRLLLDAGWN